MALSLPAVMRTTAARLSALYFLLFAVSAVILVFYMTSLSVRMLTAQTREMINEEVLGLDAAYRRGGLPLLVRTIGLRSRQPGANLYLIADVSGTILSGNVEALDPAILASEGWTDVPFSYQRYGEGGGEGAGGQAGTETRHDAIALVLRLPNRMIVLVGRDLGEPVRLQRVVSRALVLALGLMGLSGLLIWFVVGRRALRRLDTLSLASRRIMGGDLSGRLPVSGSGDEFDRLAENLNAMLARISELNEGLKQVSDNIAHDLKTPLTRLRNQAEAALAGNDDALAYRAALEGAIQRSDQLIRTFNAILMISRLEAGQSSSEAMASLDLGDTVRDVLDLYEALAEERSVALAAAVGNRPHRVNGNRELIGQALANIVDNAIKYAAPAEKPQVTVSLDAADGEIRLSVADNGPGIPSAADRERVAERFVRLEKSRTEPGSGLGLSIARAVMKFHGGWLELRDKAPGLVVVMAFPAQDASA